MPSFITPNGPIREARFQYNPDGSRDGGVHALFVISGHPEAAGCNIRQEDFEKQVSNRNIIFRIPTPVFGAGLIESITDSTIVANLNSNASTKSNFGISGRVNRNGNDGRVSRFGWKAQNLRCWSSRPRRTTSRWGSPTRGSRSSATRRRAVSSRRCPTT